MIKTKVSIDKRPGIVERKSRIGDWEGDTVIGKKLKGLLVTLAERKSRYVLVGKFSSKHSRGVITTINSLLGPHTHECHTVTFDNGKEFAEHEAIASELKADIYFTHPHLSWERGLNENTNGLLRQYFPKEMDLTTATQEKVKWAIDHLNNRPRKMLGFRSPYEVFFEMKKSHIKTRLAVSLRT